MSDPLPCSWCGQAFTPRRGGSQQTYCRAACRAAYHKAARQGCERAIADGRLTVQDLREVLQQRIRFQNAPSRCCRYPTVARGYTESPGALLQFLVEVERGTVTSLIGLRCARKKHLPPVGGSSGATLPHGVAKYRASIIGAVLDLIAACPLAECLRFANLAAIHFPAPTL